MKTTLAHALGFPRIGRQRELKKAVEAYWSGAIDDDALRDVGRRLRAEHWRLQSEAGLDLIPTNDFSFYDHVLDTAVMVDAIPERFRAADPQSDIDLRTYFRMARGDDDAPAMEMTKWFDTNYHYIVPEFAPDSAFSARPAKLVGEAREALELGVPAKPVVLGPISFLWLGKARHAGGFERLDLLDRLLPVYADVLSQVAALGVQWLQIDEPALALELPEAWLAAFGRAYAALAGGKRPKMLLATYFGGVDHVARELLELPVDGIHLDLVRAPDQLAAFLPTGKVLSLGVVDGRNVWRTDLDAALRRLRGSDPSRTWVATSCSLLHSPVDLGAETKLDPELRSWLAFSVQKLGEVKALADALSGAQPGAAFEYARKAVAERASSPRVTDRAIRARVAALTDADARRRSPFAQRAATQRARLELPPLPTTTIGSFPQTPAIRQARAQAKRVALTEAQYEARIKDEIAFAVREQERLDLDVLVHGEAERNDMVEYFGEQLRGFAFTENGWVQSYGSRCVKPPIVFGDVARPKPMTVSWITYAQSLTKRPMKGMLTGPVTILQWSFIRDDQPRSQTALEIALAIRDEVADLERSGIGIVQIDEPALREGLPLRRRDWGAYLQWAVRAFRVASSGVADETQVHTHMCYSEFNDIVQSIAELDADVITIESSRSDMELLEAFRAFKYPNEIGPGVYDIHSPRVPSEDEIQGLLRKALAVIPASQLWVNPDCGLKTRRWEEVTPSLEHMVAAAKRVRAEVTSKSHSAK